ncbi:MAG: hypothetical protein KJO69_05725 [Gammaproteobacteria bacterium]|nr:hypothetical protein [Gammaproteobacteria bacterium]
MTSFTKEQFTHDSMYLHYEGDQGSFTTYYEQPCHPTREGKAKPMFIARFKYGRKPFKTWINFICKNFTVEEWAGLMASDTYPLNTPLGAMQSKGYTGR